MANAIAHHASRITPAQITEVMAKLEAANANLHALGDLFKLIGMHTTGYAVVQPLSEVGEKITFNLIEDFYAILNSVGDLSRANAGEVA